ncbi:hypothetical protein BDD12DRAFT_693971, partial [Trichophaea hybrida]
PYNQPPMTSFFVMPDGGQVQNPKQSARRRRSGTGSDTVKHRRTRSGCFTCRTRRVKCDETHPVCERCRKGNRECTYPEVVATSRLASAKKPRNDNTTASREGSSSLEDVEEEEDEYQDGPSPPESGPRLKSTTSQSHLRGGSQSRRDSWHSTSDHGRPGKSRKTASSVDQSPSPRDPESSAPTSPTGSLRRTASVYSLVNSSNWSSLPHDVAFYLNYHQKMLTCHHYLLKSDCDDLFMTMLLEHATKNEALLYAVATFASFHYSVFYTTGAFQTFLEYYNKALAELRVSLNQEHSIDTVLTILQLACFEEYLGDWASLMEHRNAASKIINSRWTPDTMAEDPELRMIFNWFVHFDLICAMMAGHKATVGPEWSIKARQVVERQQQEYPDDIRFKIDKAMADFRDLSLNVSIMTAKRAQEDLTIEEFRQDFQAMLKECYDWWNSLDPDILRESENVSLPANDSLDDVCPFKPAPLYTGTRWAVNFILMDYYGLGIVLRHQIALTSAVDSQPEADPILTDYAIKICELLAAIEAYPHTPSGALLSAQAPIGLAALRLPNLPGYRQWVQRQLAKAEKMGCVSNGSMLNFVYPLAFRTKISEIWGDPKLKHTWIHNSSETAIGLTIRQLVDMRDAEFPQDAARQDIKAIRTLMNEMRLDSKGSGNPPPALPTP